MVVIALTRPPPGPPLHPKKHTVPPHCCVLLRLYLCHSPPPVTHTWGDGDTVTPHTWGGLSATPTPPKRAVQAQTSSVYWGKAGWGTDRQTWGG